MTHTPHDALVRDTFSDLDVARAELKRVLPLSLLKHMDLSTLRLEPGTFIDEKLAETRSDLLFSVKLRNKRVFIYWLFEHKSEPDHFVAIQLFLYVARIYEKYRAAHPNKKTLPAVIPQVFHHGASGWTCPRSLHALLDPELQAMPDLLRWAPNLEYLLDDLGRPTNAELLAWKAPIAIRVVFWALRDARSPFLLEQLTQFWSLPLSQLVSDPNGDRTVSQIVSYILFVREDITIEQLRNAVRNAGPKVEKIIMTTGERLIEQGRIEGERRGKLEGERKGKLEGERKGKLEGRREMLRQQLTRLFQKIDAKAEARLAAATAKELDCWALRILTARSIKAVFEG